MSTANTKANAISYAERSRAVQTTVINGLLNTLNIQPGEACLDLGCGTGAGTTLLSQRVGESGRVFGVDPDNSRIKEAQLRHAGANIQYLCGSICDVSLESDSVDKGLANAVVHWIPTSEKHATFKEIYRILKPGGSFLFTSSFSYNENVTLMLKYASQESREAFEGSYFMESEDFYRSLAEDVGFHVSYFHSQYGEINFPTVNEWLQWADTSFYTDFASTYAQHKDEIKFRTAPDGSIVDSGTYYMCVFTK